MRLDARREALATFQHKVALVAPIYSVILLREQSHKGLCRSFTIPICCTVNRDRYSEPALSLRLSMFRSAFFLHALKTGVQCGNACSREVCTSLAHFCAVVGRFHLRRHFAVRHAAE